MGNSHHWGRRALCRWAGRLSNCRWRWLKNALIWSFIRHYKVDLCVAARPTIDSYRHFNDFFTRTLRPDARPLAAGSEALALMPADGVLSQFGALNEGLMVQAKGHYYAVDDLLGDSERAAPYQHGHYATIYLAPRNYHRIHMPLAGRLCHSRYIKGSLFSVKDRAIQRVPQLVARNERLVCHFETAYGSCAVIMVGALIVSGIRTVWQSAQLYPKTQDWNALTAPTLERGSEMGHFCVGSTVVVLFSQTMNWQADLSAGVAVQMGQALGELERPKESIRPKEMT